MDNRKDKDFAISEIRQEVIAAFSAVVASDLKLAELHTRHLMRKCERELVWRTAVFHAANENQDVIEQDARTAAEVIDELLKKSLDNEDRSKSISIENANYFLVGSYAALEVDNCLAALRYARAALLILEGMTLDQGSVQHVDFLLAYTRTARKYALLANARSNRALARATAAEDYSEGLLNAADYFDVKADAYFGDYEHKSESFGAQAFVQALQLLSEEAREFAVSARAVSDVMKAHADAAQTEADNLLSFCDDVMDNPSDGQQPDRNSVESPDLC